MKLIKIVYSLTLSAIVSIGLGVSAAPSLPITKIPVTPNYNFTGPTNTDSHAIMGQWFQSTTASNLEYRTHEFYDNTPAAGGGPLGHLAIAGYVTNIVKNLMYPFDPKPISSFEIVATIVNDAAAIPSGSWASGTNNLLETLTTTARYSNVLASVIMTVDFASVDLISENILSPPYRYSPPPYITATNHDFTAWYGWNPGFNQDGTFYVPGWAFGTIPAGQSATRVFQFVMSNGNHGEAEMSSSDPRYELLVNSQANGTDILVNRSVSLKISQWISDPITDSGTNYPVNSITGDASNVSVFHNTVEDESQSIAINSLQWSTNLATNYLKSVGCSGIANQVLQVCTNLTHTNWVDVASNPKAWPLPQTNFWTNVNLSSPTIFYRITQP